MIGGAELITKMTLYFLHERLWFKARLGARLSALQRHMLKTLTWRLVGTLDTIFLGWLVTGDLAVGAKLGALEVFTKMALYFLHERLWYRLRYGLSERAAG